MNRPANMSRRGRPKGANQYNSGGNHFNNRGNHNGRRYYGDDKVNYSDSNDFSTCQSAPKHTRITWEKSPPKDEKAAVTVSIDFNFKTLAPIVISDQPKVIDNGSTKKVNFCFNNGVSDLKSVIKPEKAAGNSAVPKSVPERVQKPEQQPKERKQIVWNDDDNDSADTCKKKGPSGRTPIVWNGDDNKSAPRNNSKRFAGKTDRTPIVWKNNDEPNPKYGEHWNALGKKKSPVVQKPVKRVRNVPFPPEKQIKCHYKPPENGQDLILPSYEDDLRFGRGLIRVLFCPHPDATISLEEALGRFPDDYRPKDLLDRCPSISTTAPELHQNGENDQENIAAPPSKRSPMKRLMPIDTNIGKKFRPDQIV